MATATRWRLAQQYERSYWHKAAHKIASGAREQLYWYSWKAANMERQLQDWLPEDKRASARLLEIGSGPIGIASFLTWGDRFALDPLEEFYRSNEVLCALRNPQVNYRPGTGEGLPFDDRYFSLVVIDNVIDHVHKAEEVMKEISRVLADDGILYLAVNIHTTWGGLLHYLLSKTRIDKGHPYTFTNRRIRAFMRKNGFDILSETLGDYHESRTADRQSEALKDRIKGYVGLSEFVYHCVARKATRMMK